MREFHCHTYIIATLNFASVPMIVFLRREVLDEDCNELDADYLYLRML